MKPRSTLLATLVTVLSSALTANATVVNIDGAAEAQDQFGFSTASGDFDCDGFDDLAIGVYNEDNGRGAVNIIYGGQGSSDKLGSSGNELMKANEFWNAQPGDTFGVALAAGNFNGDLSGCDDLAIGAPSRDINGVNLAGAVVVAYGEEGVGPDASTAEVWFQGVGSLGSSPEDTDEFGRSLAAGDFNGDGMDDLAVGVPFEGINGEQTDSAGAVQIIYGAVGGLDSNRASWLVHQNTSGIKGQAEGGDVFGWSLAVGDFDNNGKDDLAIGVRGENNSQGAVAVLYGKSGGLSDTDDLWMQGTTSSGTISNTPENNDFFGFSVAAGNFNDDDYDDLAIGVPGENGSRGALHVIYGSDDRLSDAGDDFYHQGTSGVPTARSSGDRFGDALVAADFNGDNLEDLAIAATGEACGSEANAGAVHLFYGRDNGLAPSHEVNVEYLDQDTAGMDNICDASDKLGVDLSTGDFNDDGLWDLVIGVPFEDLAGNSVRNAGGVHVQYGHAFGVATSGNHWFVQ